MVETLQGTGEGRVGGKGPFEDKSKSTTLSVSVSVCVTVCVS